MEAKDYVYFDQKNCFKLASYHPNFRDTYFAILFLGTPIDIHFFRT